MLEENKIHQGDCMELMQHIPDKSVDMILCDLPYGTTQNEWDKVLPLDELWKQYKRIIKDKGAILLFSDEPFTSELIMSNCGMFKQRITWNKDKKFGFLNSHKMLLKQTEDICLFYKNLPTYNPQMVRAKTERGKYAQKDGSKSSNYGKIDKIKRDDDYEWQKSFPSNLIKLSCNIQECNSLNRLHPTQKPIKLVKWFIQTYTNEGELVLDNCIGSGTTAVACKQTNRRFIGIELNQEYVDIANERLKFTTVSDFYSEESSNRNLTEDFAKSSQINPTD